jgi:hypothetical protein
MTTLLVGPALVSAGSHPEDTIWKYIDTEFEAAARDPTYWQRRWNFEGELKREDIRLGKPCCEYYMNEQGLELFVRSGDLLGAASLGDTSYPVFRKNDLIGSVQLSDSAGQWTFVGRHLVGPVDSLAAARGEIGETVAILGIHHLGAFTLVTPAASAETRVYPISRNEALEGRMDQPGSVSYATACEVLRLQAEDWLKKHQRPAKR